MENLSIEMKKIILFTLKRISFTEIRMLTTQETYLQTLQELNELESTWGREIIGAQNDTPNSK